MHIVVRHNDSGWWWTAVGVNGQDVAVSVLHESRAACVKAIAEMKVEGPPAQVAYDEVYAARPGTWTISNLMPSGS